MTERLSRVQFVWDLCWSLSSSVFSLVSTFHWIITGWSHWIKQLRVRWDFAGFVLVFEFLSVLTGWHLSLDHCRFVSLDQAIAGAMGLCMVFEFLSVLTG